MASGPRTDVRTPPPPLLLACPRCTGWNWKRGEGGREGERRLVGIFFGGVPTEEEQKGGGGHMHATISPPLSIGKCSNPIALFFFLRLCGESSIFFFSSSLHPRLSSFGKLGEVKKFLRPSPSSEKGRTEKEMYGSWREEREGGRILCVLSSPRFKSRRPFPPSFASHI